jgi:hypothetical protein
LKGSAPTPRVLDADTEHTVKNHLAVILGLCELLLAERRQTMRAMAICRRSITPCAS